MAVVPGYCGFADTDMDAVSILSAQDFSDQAALPGNPAALARVLDIIADPCTDTPAIARVLAGDPASAQRIMKAARSPALGVRERVTTLERAVTVLGPRVVQDLLFEVGGDRSFDASRYWLHAFAVAAAARAIARDVAYEPVQEAYTAGLVHDAGRLALGHVARHRFAEVREEIAAGGRPAVEVEVRILGVDHTEIGVWAARTWKLPETCLAAISGHHDDPRRPRRPAETAAAARHVLLVAIVALADYYAWTAGIGSLDAAPRPDLAPGVASLIPAGRVNVDRVLTLMDEELQRVGKVLGVEGNQPAPERTIAESIAMLHEIHERHQITADARDRSSRFLGSFSRIQQSIRSSGSPERAIQQILDFAGKELWLETVHYFSVDAPGRSVRFEATSRAAPFPPERISAVETVLASSGGLLDRLIASREPFFSSVSCVGSCFAPPLDSLRSNGYPAPSPPVTGRAMRKLCTGVAEESLQWVLGSENFLAVPVAGQRDLVGFFPALPGAEIPLEDYHAQTLQILAAQFGLVIENAFLAREIAERDIHDELTGLYSRRHALELLPYEVKRGKRFGQDLGLALIDLDNLRYFSDTFGSLAAEYLVVELASLVADNSREVDLVCRFGAGTFMALLPSTSWEGALDYSERIRTLIQRLGEERAPEVGSFAPTVSIGISHMASTDRDLDGVHLLNQAQLALSQAKKEGKNRVCLRRAGDPQPGATR